MKKALAVLSLSFIALSMNAQPPEGEAKSGESFGKKFEAREVISINKLTSDLAVNEPKTVVVEGTVTEVCKAEGCWLKLDSEKGPIMVKMKNHAFLVPLAMNGKKILVSGTAKLSETSVEMLRHYAEDAGKSKEEIEKIKEPKKEVVIQAEGIVVI